MSDPYRPTEPRIAPAEDGTVEDGLSEIAHLLRSERRGMVLNVTRTVARHPELMRRWSPLGGFLARDGLLDPRSREIVILRIGWRCRAVYEYGQHSIFGLGAGLTDGEIRALTQEASDWPWADVERDLVVMVDELYEDNCVSDATWARLATRWSIPELLELLALTGFYWGVSVLLNSAGVQREAGVPGWPDDPEGPHDLDRPLGAER